MVVRPFAGYHPGPGCAPQSAAMDLRGPVMPIRARHMPIPARRVALIVAVVFSALVAIPASAADGPQDDQSLIVSIAEQQLGKRFQLGSNGPNRFDCSGLVYFVYDKAGLEDRIGGKRYTADEFYKWGLARGLVSTDNPRVGDLILWKPNKAAKVKHMGLYIGETVPKLKGKNKGMTPGIAISALTIGVSPRPAKFTAFALWNSPVATPRLVTARVEGTGHPHWCLDHQRRRSLHAQPH